MRLVSRVSMVFLDRLMHRHACFSFHVKELHVCFPLELYSVSLPRGMYILRQIKGHLV